MNKKMSDDLFDEFFSEIERTVNPESLNEFTKKINEQVNSSLKSSGYQDFNSVFNYGMDIARRNITGSQTLFQAPKMVVDRQSFIQNELSKIRYDMRKRGAYREGHEAALKVSYGWIIQFENESFLALREVKAAIKQAKKNRRKNDRYDEGYIDGLKDVRNILIESDHFMMSKVRFSLNKCNF